MCKNMYALGVGMYREVCQARERKIYKAKRKHRQQVTTILGCRHIHIHVKEN